MKGLLFCSYKNQVMKTPTKNRGALPSARRRKGQLGYWTVWVRWPGTSAPWECKTLAGTGAECTLIPSDYKGAEPICISGVTGGFQVHSVLEAEVSVME